MRRKIMVLILIFSVFGWLSFWLFPPPAGATPTNNFPAAEFAEQTYQSGGEVRAVLRYSDTLVIAHPDLTLLYDGSDVSNPVLIGRIEGFTALVHSGRYVYGPTAITSSVWAVWDIAQPLTPLQMGTFQTTGTFLAGSENYLIFDEATQYNPNIGIYSLSDPAMPLRVGQWNDYFVKWALLDGDRMYAGAYSLYCDHGVCDLIPAHLKILDLSGPANPTSVGNGTVAMSARAYSTIYDGFLYQRSTEAEASDTIEISHITEEPATITPVARIELDGFYPGSITLYENTLYLTDGITTRIFDVTDPATPVPVGTVAEAIVGVVYEQYLYRLWKNDWFDDLRRYVPIYDLTNPADPLVVTTILNAAGNWMHKGANNLLYIVDTPYDYSLPNVLTYFHTVDVSNPDEPVLVRSDTLQPNPNGSAAYQFHVVQDNYLYVTRFAHQGTKDGVDIYRLPTATTPLTFIRTLQIDVWRTAVVDNAFLVQKGVIERELDIYNTSDPENPFRNAQLTIDHNGFSDIITEGNFAYLLEGGEPATDARIFILDITTPGIPRIAGSFDGDVSMSQANQWVIANGYIYYPHVNGLGIADVRNPAAPMVTVVDSIPVTWEEPWIYSDGQRLYIRTIDCGVHLRIYDLAIPTAPRLSTLMQKHEPCSDNGHIALVPTGTHFYIAEDERGLRAYEFVQGIAHFLPILNRAP
jgi:hypothetical protein